MGRCIPDFPHRHECLLASNMPARVTVVMQDGTVHTLYVAQPLGAPDNPISDENLFAKFRISVKTRMPASAADRVIDLVWNLDKAGSVRDVIDRLCV